MPTADFQQTFQNAVSLQQQKKYDEALAAYKSLLEQQNPDLSRDQIADISYNAALTSFNKQDFLSSYVYNQKALLLSPRHSQASELAAKIKTQFQVRATPHDISLIENLNKAGLDVVPVEAFWVLATLFLVIFLRSIFRYFLKRKKELMENLKFSRFSYKNYLWLVLFVVFYFFAGIKIWDEQIPKALIRTEQASLKTAAGENQATLADLPGGSLVHILRVTKVNDIQYFQIKYPGGISGWTKKDDLELILPKD